LVGVTRVSWVDLEDHVDPIPKLRIGSGPAIRHTRTVGGIGPNEDYWLAINLKVALVEEVLVSEVAQIFNNLGGCRVPIPFGLIIYGPSQAGVGGAATRAAVKNVLERGVCVMALPPPGGDEGLDVRTVSEADLRID
jgi:hypothetical protein